MRGQHVAITLALATVCMLAVSAQARDKVDETRKVEPDAEITVNNLAGEIEVIGWDKNEVRVEGTLDDKAEKLVISGDEGDLKIKVKYPRKIRGNMKGSDLKVHVPHGCRLATESVSCDVSVSGVNGRVEIESVSGDIVIRDEPESVEIASVSGLIEVDVTSERVEIESVSGDIFVKGVRDELEISSVSGDVEVKADVLNRFSFNVVSGELDITSRPAPGGRWEIDCHSGEVTLYLPADVNATFEIDTFSGDIDDDFGHKAHRTSKYAPGKELSFTQGDGGAQIEISIFSGEVSIVKR